MPEADDAAMTPAPITGHPEVDAATAALAGVEEAPLGEHPDRLAAVHEVLHDQLQDQRSGLSDERLDAQLDRR